MLRLPQTFDLVAHYEPRGDFALTAGVRRNLDELARKYRQPTFMSGRHSGKPELHTDIKGISVGTRIEVSRVILREDRAVETLADAFRLFIEAAERGVASGPIQRIMIGFRKSTKRPEPRAKLREAFRQIFDCDARFGPAPKGMLEMGRVVRHQTLLQHLREDGPYHSSHQHRIETVRGELQRSAGRYENHRFFVQPVPHDDNTPSVRFCYSGSEQSLLVEVAMRQKTDEQLVFVTPEQLEKHPDQYVSLSDYDEASRRYGRLWVMQNDLVRELDRARVAAIYLFFDEHGEPEIGRWFSWQELFERQRESRHINRSSRRSPSHLDLCLRHLDGAEFIEDEKDRFMLHPDFRSFEHVTFYELGTFDKRLASV